MNTVAATLLLLLHPAQCLRFRRGSFGDLEAVDLDRQRVHEVFRHRRGNGYEVAERTAAEEQALRRMQQKQHGCHMVHILTNL